MCNLWKPEYELGIPEMDNQHRQLAEHIRLLQEALESCRTPQEIGGLLNNMIQVTLCHSGEEEALMAGFGYRGLEAHRREHGNLIAQAMGFKKAFENDSAALSPVVLQFFQGWLCGHIITSDKQAAQALGAQHP